MAQQKKFIFLTNANFFWTFHLVFPMVHLALLVLFLFFFSWIFSLLFLAFFRGVFEKEEKKTQNILRSIKTKCLKGQQVGFKAI
jgi:hypothetical protein